MNSFASFIIFQLCLFGLSPFSKSLTSLSKEIEFFSYKPSLHYGVSSMSIQFGSTISFSFLFSKHYPSLFLFHFSSNPKQGQSREAIIFFVLFWISDVESKLFHKLRNFTLDYFLLLPVSECFHQCTLITNLVFEYLVLWIVCWGKEQLPIDFLSKIWGRTFQ